MKMKIKVLAALLLSTCTLYTAQTQADQKFGFAKRCSLPDAPMPIKFRVDDYIENFDGMAYNIIYVAADQRKRGDLYSLYSNSDGYNYLKTKPATGRDPFPSTVLLYDNNPSGTTGSYLSKPVCMDKSDCQPYPADWHPTVGRGLSAYNKVLEQYPNDFIYVHSGMFPSLSDDSIDTTIFTMTRNFEYLRVEVFAVTKIGDPNVTSAFMDEYGAEPIVFEYGRAQFGNPDYYIGADSNHLTRPMAGSLPDFPAHLDKNIQAMDFYIKYPKGYLGEVVTSAKFYYFSDKQKEILSTCN